MKSMSDLSKNGTKTQTERRKVKSVMEPEEHKEQSMMKVKKIHADMRELVELKERWEGKKRVERKRKWREEVIDVNRK